MKLIKIFITLILCSIVVFSAIGNNGFTKISSSILISSLDKNYFNLMGTKAGSPIYVGEAKFEQPEDAIFFLEAFSIMMNDAGDIFTQYKGDLIKFAPNSSKPINLIPHKTLQSIGQFEGAGGYYKMLENGYILGIVQLTNGPLLLEKGCNYIIALFSSSGQLLDTIQADWRFFNYYLDYDMKILFQNLDGIKAIDYSTGKLTVLNDETVYAGTPGMHILAKDQDKFNLENIQGEFLSIGKNYTYTTKDLDKESGEWVIRCYRKNHPTATLRVPYKFNKSDNSLNISKHFYGTHNNEIFDVRIVTQTSSQFSNNDHLQFNKYLLSK